MTDDRGLLDQPIVREQADAAAAGIAEQQFTVDELVANHLATLQQRAQRGGERFAACQKPDPRRGVGENHRYADLRSRRRGASWAPASVPRKARRRWLAACRIRASRPYSVARHPTSEFSANVA